jgi:DNA-binding NarL/FixJ family response regulator
MKKGRSRRRIYCYASTPGVPSILEASLKSDDVLLSHFTRPRECLEKLSIRSCDLLIVDMNDRETEGFALLTEARRMAPWISVLVIVADAAVSCAVKAVKAGACECLERSVDAGRLLEAVGEQLIRSGSSARPRRVLTHMEIQIIQLILAGKTSQDIAIHLHRSKRTVDVHRKNIMRKLHACSLVDLIRRALEMGLANEPDSGETSNADRS